jgi:CubicO group peptidase (beta-lactamase class C family)
MLKPLRLLFESLRQFAIGLGPAIVMAFVCLAIQHVLPNVVASGWTMFIPPEPPIDLDNLLNDIERYDWRDDARQLLSHTAFVSTIFFFHVLVALILTAWLLRRQAGFDRLGVLGRAVQGACVLTLAAAVVFAAAYLADDLLRATRYLPFDFGAAAMIAVWFGGTALLLPARVMGHEPVAASGFLRNTLVATIALVPWFYASEVIGAPLRHCHECGGFFEGGCFFYPLLGAYLLGLTVSSAAVSAAACMPTKERQQAAAPVALALILIVTGNAAAQPRFDSIARANLAQDRAVGAVVAVVKGDDTLFLETYGKMDVESDVPMRPDAIFGIGSITKQFTAAAILKLRDRGKLSLDDDVTKWLPDFDTRGNQVPLRRLLDHTSGIPDVTTKPAMREIGRNAALPPDAMYARIKRYPFEFATGTAQIYSNSAYWLLHLVIEKASGMRYQQFIAQELFAPLGMKSSGFCLSEENVPRRATGYRVRNGTVDRRPLNVSTWYLGSGALCSTAGDLVTWLQALHGGKVLSPASYAAMIEPATLNDGTRTRYAMGLEVRTDARGLRFIGHSGELPGYAARANWYPDARMAVVVLMNNSGDASPSAMAADLAAEVLPITRRAPRAFAGDAAPLTGTYEGRGRDGDLVVSVRQKGEGIAVSIDGGPARAVSWVDGLTFQDGAALLTFRRAGGAVKELGYDAGSGYYILQRLTASAAIQTRMRVFVERFLPLIVLGVMAAFACLAVLWWRNRRNR